MSIFTRKKSRDHDISGSTAAAFGAALVAGVLTALPPSRVVAQAPCTTIANDAERLACYDRALRGAPPPAAAPPAADAPARAAAPAAPVAPPAAPAEPRREERRVRESTAPTAPAAPVAGSADEAEAIIPLVIVGVRALPGRETTFTADDGRTWVQTDGQRVVGLPEAPFDAELKPGAMGSFFLVPKDRGRAIRVRQTR